jgi:lysophospholipase L1-like esterase
MKISCFTAAVFFAGFFTGGAGPAFSQDTKPEDENAVNSKKNAARSMLDDSPVVFPEKGALPSKYPTDVKTERLVIKGDDGYSITTSPARSLKQIDAIQAEMPKGKYALPPTDWENLLRTKRVLTEGGDLHIVGLGDSIVNDIFRSAWLAKLAEAYPKANIRGNVYVRGGGGCRHYWKEERVPKYLVPLKPDLVFIGGISQQKNYEAIRSVITQIRKDLPETEILLASGAFGGVDPRRPDALANAQHSGTSDYGVELKKIAAEMDCAYLDMTKPWAEYIRSSGKHPHIFYRDRVHANAYGEQILSNILLSFFDVTR